MKAEKRIECPGNEPGPDIRILIAGKEIMYHWYQWLAFFYIYGFLGWIWETAYVSIGKRCFVNRGFVHGPIIPIYAFGALSMLVLALPVKDNLVLSYVLGVAGTTLLELVTGWAMEKIFRVRYWDYRYRKIQFHGYISLVSSLFWGFLTILLVNWMHPPIEEFIRGMDTGLLLAVDGALSVVFLSDFVISTKQALDLRKVLISLERLYAEMEAVQKELAAHLEKQLEESRERMDERITRSKEKLEGYREMAATRMENGRELMADRMEESRERMEESWERMKESREHVEESRERMSAALEERREQAWEKRRELEQRLARLRETNEQRRAYLVTAREKLRLRHPTASFGRWDDLTWQQEPASGDGETEKETQPAKE